MTHGVDCPAPPRGMDSSEMTEKPKGDCDTVSIADIPKSKAKVRNDRKAERRL